MGGTVLPEKHHTREPLLEIRNLKTYFHTRLGVVRGVDGVTLDVAKAGITGVVGESGCGKSVVARSVLGIVAPPGRIDSGQILYHGFGESPLDLASLSPTGEQMRMIRGREISIIFQEPMSCLSPVHTVGNQLTEALNLYDRSIGRKAALAQAVEMLSQVGIPSPSELVDSYTFELSGGMRQRVLIALALVGNPKLLIADEPTTAIDVTLQAKILDLLLDLHRQNGLSILFITHNMGVIAQIAHDVVVMYLGRVVERGPVSEIFDHPKHPYTQALLRSIPRTDVEPMTRLETITGSVPDPRHRPPGCAFSNRCSFAIADLCTERVPLPVRIGDGHEVSCFLHGDGGGEE